MFKLKWFEVVVHPIIVPWLMHVRHLAKVTLRAAASIRPASICSGRRSGGRKIRNNIKRSPPRDL